LQTAAGTGSAADENWVVRKDGTRFWASGFSVARRAEGGAPAGFVKVFRDLSERQQAHEALREGELRLRAALAAAEMGTWLWQVPTDKQTLDENLHRLMGLVGDRTVHNLDDFLTLIHPDDRPAVGAAFERSVRDGSPLLVEFRVTRPDGSVRWLRDKGEAVQGPDGTVQYLTGAAVDVTDGRAAADELRRARDELERRVEERTAELKASQERAVQAERLAAIGQTVTALAHEGRGALQRANACLTMLDWKLEGRPEEVELSGRVRQALGDLERLFEDVRTYAAPVQLDKKPCDLRQVWREAWAQATARCVERSAHFSEDGAGTARLCQADPFRLGQVFLNLFANALDACPDPVRVTITCEEAALGGRPAVRVAVRDNGPGFPAEYRGRAFEPFRTTKAKGTGLGLAISRRLVEAHGGEVSVGEAAGGGAEVVLTLPLGGV
jgi:PAS domain S-box-containing protein